MQWLFSIVGRPDVVAVEPQMMGVGEKYPHQKVRPAQSHPQRSPIPVVCQMT